MQIRMVLMNRAQKIRNDLGKTQREVSIAVGITERTIARLEGGLKCSGRNLEKLADYYECTIDELLGRTAAAPRGSKQ